MAGHFISNRQMTLTSSLGRPVVAMLMVLFAAPTIMADQQDHHHQQQQRKNVHEESWSTVSLPKTTATTTTTTAQQDIHATTSHASPRAAIATTETRSAFATTRATLSSSSSSSSRRRDMLENSPQQKQQQQQQQQQLRGRRRQQQQDSTAAAKNSLAFPPWVSSVTTTGATIHVCTTVATTGIQVQYYEQSKEKADEKLHSALYDTTAEMDFTTSIVLTNLQPDTIHRANVVWGDNAQKEGFTLEFRTLGAADFSVLVSSSSSSSLTSTLLEQLSPAPLLALEFGATGGGDDNVSLPRNPTSLSDYWALHRSNRHKSASSSSLPLYHFWDSQEYCGLNPSLEGWNNRDCPTKRQALQALQHYYYHSTESSIQEESPPLFQVIPAGPSADLIVVDAFWNAHPVQVVDDDAKESIGFRTKEALWKALLESKARWKIVVVVGPTLTLEPQQPFWWDYRTEALQLMTPALNRIPNMVLLTPFWNGDDSFSSLWGVSTFSVAESSMWLHVNATHLTVQSLSEEKQTVQLEAVTCHGDRDNVFTKDEKEKKALLVCGS